MGDRGGREEQLGQAVALRLAGLYSKIVYHDLRRLDAETERTLAVSFSAWPEQDRPPSPNRGASRGISHNQRAGQGFPWPAHCFRSGRR